MHFYLKRKTVALREVSPTEPEVLKAQIEGIDKILVPIVCLEYNNKYYVLDGHARCLRAKQSGLKTIQAMILLPQIRVDFGIVNTAKEMGIRTLDDITILE
jgi:IMP dehydrogenase